MEGKVGNPLIILISSVIAGTLNTVAYLVELLPIVFAIIGGGVTVLGATYAMMRQRDEYLKTRRSYEQWLKAEYNRVIRQNKTND